MPRPKSIGPLASAAWLLVASVAAAEPTGAAKLEQVEKRLEESRARQQSLDEQAARLAAEQRDLRTRAAAAARRVQEHEAEASAIEATISELTERERTKTLELNRRRGQIAELLGGLARLSRQPREAMLLSPNSLIDTVRASQILSTTVPEIESRALTLRNDLQELAAVRNRLAADQTALQSTLHGLTREREELEALRAQSAEARQQTLAERRDEAKRAARLANQAKDLKTLIERLSEEDRRRAEREQRQAALPSPSGSDAQIAGFPARGRLIGRFGEDDTNGAPRNGIVIETRSGAQVTAPASGRVAFAGPFRGYGELLIIAHAGGYHTLLAGFARIDSMVGQSLLAGEPVGLMPDNGGEKPTLYFELRLKGEPINPLPWLAAGERKVSG